MNPPPVSNALEGRRLAERVQRLRSNALAGYGIALVSVALATVIRWAIGGHVMQGIPFITYFPAIVLATLLGGFRPGVLATILSGLLAWVVFIPPEFKLVLSQPEALTLLMFFLVSALLVGLVTALNSAMDRLLVQEKTIRAEVEQRRHTELAALRLAAIVESSDDAIVTKDLNGIITSWNKGAERLFGYVADEAIGKPVSILIPPDRPSEEPDILERLRRGERIDHYETMRRCKDGSLIDISLTVSPLVNAEGKIIGASKIARDITERKRASEAQEMLTREMSHRVKNAFAVVNGIVGLSALSSSTPDAMARQIRECLTALSRAHDLTRPGLLEPVSMSRQSTTFKALVRTIFAPYLDAGKSTGRDRLIIKGPDVPIAEKSLTGLALLLHELATNAVKYGSLSSPKGCVGIKTSTANGEFLMTWKEEDGPRLGGPPNEEGFGSLLVRRIVTGQFGGRLSYDWRPEGLVVCLSGPMERLASVEGETSGAHSALSTIVRN